MKAKENKDWIKSSYSQGNGACLEIKVDSAILARDSKLDNGPVVGFSAGGFTALVDHAKHTQL